MNRKLHPDLSAVILAGGHSRRMGQDKALLSLQGQTLLLRSCALAQNFTERVYVVTPWGDRYRSLLPSPCRIVPEPWPEHHGRSSGPLVGFFRGLAPVDTPWVLLLACDLPYLTPEVFAPWIPRLRTLDPDTVALLAQSPPYWQCLAGFYRTSVVDRLETAIHQGERSFQRWLGGQKIHTMAPTDPRVFQNCNDPQSWAQVQRDFSSDR